MNIAEAKQYNLRQRHAPDVLAALGALTCLTMTGRWTDAEVLAIARLQAQLGLVADGKVGPRTVAAVMDSFNVDLPLDISLARPLAPSMEFFVDVSEHQTFTSYRQAVASVDYFVLKASQGEAGRDPKLEQHIKGIRDAGGTVKALYHYAQHVGRTGAAREPESNATRGARNLAGACIRHGVTNAILDLEPLEVTRAWDAGWTPDRLESWAREFLDALLVEPVRVKVYLSGETVRRARGAFDFLKTAGYPLWWAGYAGERFTYNPATVLPIGHLAGWPRSRWAWQYRGGDNKKTPRFDGGLCPGIKGDVDTNMTPRGGGFWE